jgi:hypothetical protein
MLEHLKNAGWESYQWRNSKEGRTSFLEMTGAAYSDFKRTESTTGIRHAVEAMLNRIQAIQKCEQAVGHDFTGRKGYDNGVLACRHCGFGGYTSTFERQARDAEHWKMRFELVNERLALAQMRAGVHFNAVGNVLLENKRIPATGKEDGYTVIGDTDMVSFIVEQDPQEVQNEPVFAKIKET